MFRRLRLWLAHRVMMRRLTRAGLAASEAERLIDYILSGKGTDYAFTRKGFCTHGVSLDWPCVQCNLLAQHFASDARDIQSAEAQSPLREAENG